MKLATLNGATTYHPPDRRDHRATGCASPVAKAIKKPPRIGIRTMPRRRTISTSLATGVTTPLDSHATIATAAATCGSALTIGFRLASLVDNAAILSSI